MAVKPKQKHLTKAPQEYYDLRVQVAQRRVHLRAICHRYDNEIAEQFPDQDLVYALVGQITTEQQEYSRTEEKLAQVSSRLKFTGNVEEDKKNEKQRAQISYTVRKLHWGGHQAEERYPSPPSTPSPPPRPPPLTPSKTDVWTTFRDTASTVMVDEDSPNPPAKKVHFAELPRYSKRMWLKKFTDKVEDIACGVTNTPLLDALRCAPDTTILARTTASPKKRLCVDDDYAQLPDYSPTKRAKKNHATPWPEAYLFEDLDVFRDCEGGDEGIENAMRSTKDNGSPGEESCKIHLHV